MPIGSARIILCISPAVTDRQHAYAACAAKLTASSEQKAVGHYRGELSTARKL